MSAPLPELHANAPLGVDPAVGVYLDGFATTVIAPEALAAMVEAFALPANASSPHALGERAAAIIDDARAAIAGLLGCSPAELTFTSGATEADNLAITGLAHVAPADRRRIVVSEIEHRAVLEPADALINQGFDVVRAPVDKRGVVDLERLPAIIGDDCWLVSIMAVNNETGVVQPIAEITRLAHERGALMHTDAAQAAGKMHVDLAAWDVDYASVTAHKMHGPVGIGALYVATGAPPPKPLQLGGGQQAGRRSGTEPVALIAGFGAAAALAAAGGGRDADRRAALLARLLEVLSENQIRWVRVSDDAPTISGGCAIEIVGVDADSLCQRLQSTIFLSTSSACSSGQIQLSHVLSSMGIGYDRGRSVIRLMVDATTTVTAIEAASRTIAAAASAH